MPIYSLGDKAPDIDNAAFVAPDAQLIGNVIMFEDSSVWFNVVIRAEDEAVNIGANSNIQDGAVCHVDPGFPLTIGSNVTVGHKAMLHGATIADNSLIGINAVVLNGANIGEGCLIGAGALVPEGMEVPARSLVMGVPAKIKRQLSDEELERLKKSAQNYVERAKFYKAELRQL